MGINAMLNWIVVKTAHQTQIMPDRIF